MRPREIGKLAHLGATKLYLLAPLEPGARRRLTGRTPVPMLGGREARTIDAMTVGELRKVVAGGEAFTSGSRSVPIGKLLESIEYEIAGLDARMDLLIGRADAVEPDAVVELRDRLVAMVEELEEGFGPALRMTRSCRRVARSSPPAATIRVRVFGYAPN